MDLGYKENEGKREIYDRCGIMTACLNDPLSQIISKIMGLKENDVNSVGFYYEGELHGVRKCTVILFNIYDNDPVPWLRLGYTMDLLLASPFVSKITYYPIETATSSSRYSQTSILNRSGIRSKPVSKRLEENFRAAVVQTIGNNAKGTHDKNISYTSMLLKVAGVTGEEIDKLVNSVQTGYSLVNKVLITLMGIESGELSKISSSIIPCPLLKRPISISAPRETTNESDIRYIVEESRREITKLAAVFVDLFTTNDTFREYMLSTGGGKTNQSALNRLLMNESELVSHLVGGLNNGIISSTTINNIIRDINIERFNLGNHEQLQTTKNLKRNIEVIDDNMMCTFKTPDSVNNMEHLKDLGEYLQYIVDSFEDPKPMTINMGCIISCYNNIIESTNLNKIKIGQKNKKCTLSRTSVVTIPGSSGCDTVQVPIDSNIIFIPMYNPNLSMLNESQLMDVLVYLDSLRNSDGTGDTRYSNLQNEITNELACRRQSK